MINSDSGRNVVISAEVWHHYTGKAKSIVGYFSYLLMALSHRTIKAAKEIHSKSTRRIDSVISSCNFNEQYTKE